MPNRAYATTPVDVRFWTKVEQTEGCWRWNGYTNGIGYGLLQVRRRRENFRKNLYAHRISWEIHNGPIPDGLFVLHRCDNPACTRPDHLFLGTNTDNMRDCVAKGRDNREAKGSPGESNPIAKLTEKDVLAIRASKENGVLLGERYGVTKSSISGIRRGVSWRSIL